MKQAMQILPFLSAFLSSGVLALLSCLPCGSSFEFSSARRFRNAAYLEGISLSATPLTTREEKEATFSIPDQIPNLSSIMETVTKDDFRQIKGSTKQSNQVSSPRRKRRTGHENQSSQTVNPKKKSQAERKPWRADYHASLKTQRRIKQAASQGKTPIQKATNVLRTLLQTPPSECNPANLVCALTLSAKCLGTRTNTTADFRAKLFDVLKILNQQVIDKRLKPRQLCNAAWAIAKHYERDERILPPTPRVSASSSVNQKGVTETWFLDGLDKKSPRLVDETIDEIAYQLIEILQQESEDESDTRVKVGEICMASWAYGILRPRRRPPGWENPPRCGHLRHPGQSQPSARARDVITFEVWNSNRNLSEERRGPVEVTDRTDILFDAIGEALCRRQSDGDRLSENLRFEECTWSELANLAWAYERHGSCLTESSQKMLQNLAREASFRLRQGGAVVNPVLPRDIAQLLWALGTLQSDNFRLAEDLVDLVDAVATHLDLDENGHGPNSDRPLRDWTCPDLVQLALSLAHARIDELSLLRALFTEANHRLLGEIDISSIAQRDRKSFRAWEAGVLLWAQARLYLKEEQGAMFEVYARETPRFLLRASQHCESLEEIGIGQQEQANIAWSMAVLEQHHSREASDLLKTIFLAVVDSCREQQQIQLEHAHQLWQALFVLEDDCPMAVENVPNWFRDYLRENWQLEKARPKLSSARHRSLSQLLRAMGVAHYNEHDEDIDVAIVLKGKAAWTHQTNMGSESTSALMKVAVEFDGPNHFTRQGRVNADGVVVTPRALGHTVLKYRLLKKQGWTVVRVPFYEFDKIPFWASMERQRYLQRLLKTHADIRFSDVDVSEYSTPMANRRTRFD